MKSIPAILAVIWGLLLLLVFPAATAAEAGSDNPPPAPHTPTLIFYLTGASAQADDAAIRTAVQKLKSASTLEVNTNRSYARVRFDSHVVSYHQVAQAITDAGKSLGKNYNPFLIFFVSDYCRSNNAERVNAILAGKRLNTRVKVTPIDNVKGTFAVHFLPLKDSPGHTTLPGFNGGHLHHPVSDPPPRGLGLTSGYASTDVLPSGPIEIK